MVRLLPLAPISPPSVCPTTLGGTTNAVMTQASSSLLSRSWRPTLRQSLSKRFQPHVAMATSPPTSILNTLLLLVQTLARRRQPLRHEPHGGQQAQNQRALFFFGRLGGFYTSLASWIPMNQDEAAYNSTRSSLRDVDTKHCINYLLIVCVEITIDTQLHLSLCVQQSPCSRYW